MHTIYNQFAMPWKLRKNDVAKDKVKVDSGKSNFIIKIVKVYGQEGGRLSFCMFCFCLTVFLYFYLSVREFLVNIRIFMEDGKSLWEERRLSFCSGSLDWCFWLSTTESERNWELAKWKIMTFFCKSLEVEMIRLNISETNIQIWNKIMRRPGAI